MAASRFLKKVKKPAKFQSAVSMCQFLSPGTLLYRKRVYNVYQDLRMHLASGTNFSVKFSDTAAPQVVSELKFRVQVWDLNGTRQLKVSDPSG